MHATINNNTRVSASTVRIIAEDFTRNNSIWATISSPGPYFRGSFCTVVNSKAFGANRNVRYIVCVRFSEVSGVGGSTVELDINPNSHFNLGSANYDITYDEYKNASGIYTDCTYVITVMLIQLKIG